jgi:uncharacterized protein (DUF1015 family)
MATIRPFRGIRYAPTAGRDLSDFVAPPYDVLDDAGKARLLERSAYNLVAIDLPHMPPKSVGPQAAYDAAGTTFRNWLDAGVLVREPRAAVYPYEQRYTHAGKSYARRGVIALVRLTPFGVDVIPHEKTYAGAIEDRLKLMHATRAQLSPVFGLFMDDDDEILTTLFSQVSLPAAEATLDGVTSRLWSVFDARVEQQIIDLFQSKKIYIADGHHRYTTALQYQRDLEQRHGPLPEAHPANYCMMVLVNGADPGLLILPTHRLIGGLAGWDVEAFCGAVGEHFEITRTPLRPDHVDELCQTLPGYGRHAFGLYDGATRQLLVLKLKDADLMSRLEPDQSPAWRSLDVAILQRYLIEEVLAKRFGGGGLTRGYTAYDNEVAPKVDSGEYQIALLIQPTPIRALADLGEHGEVMPQKSTFFYPKLATGMVIAGLDGPGDD